MKWICRMCGFVYDPKSGDPQVGVPPGTPWGELPAGWTCPICGAPKGSFYSFEERLRKHD